MLSGARGDSPAAISWAGSARLVRSDRGRARQSAGRACVVARTAACGYSIAERSAAIGDRGADGGGALAVLGHAWIPAGRTALAGAHTGRRSRQCDLGAGDGVGGGK